MVVLCYHHVQAFGRPEPITGSPRGRRQSRPRRSDVVFTPVTTHSCGREKVTVSRWCGHERLNCGLQKPCDTSYYMLSEPCLVVRPFSRTAVRHVPPSTVSVAYRESTREPLRAREKARPRSNLGSVSLAMHPTHPVLACGWPGPVTEPSRWTRLSGPCSGPLSSALAKAPTQICLLRSAAPRYSTPPSTHIAGMERGNVVTLKMMVNNCLCAAST